MLKTCTFAILFLTAFISPAQELFPVAEPASTIPKGALGIRAFDEGYPEVNLFRNVIALKAMYGITSKLTVYATADISDYHEKTLPFDFITHNHSPGGNPVPGVNTPQQGIPYPYVFNSIDVYAKYRFLTHDGQNTHFRIAAYAEGSDVFVPSHEAEPDLLIHTSGFGAGVISTYLSHNLAISLTAGFIFPLEYKGNTYDQYGGVYPTTIQYGNAINYDLSFGYLLYPGKYKSYAQTNWNIYCEFIGKSYGAATIYQKDGPYSYSLTYDLPITTPSLKAATYVDINPGLQCIINSTYRIDLSLGFPLVGLSYDHLYPLYLLGIQRYFFFTKRSRKAQQ
jgi:hypothetical protein